MLKFTISLALKSFIYTIILTNLNLGDDDI